MAMRYDVRHPKAEALVRAGLMEAPPAAKEPAKEPAKDPDKEPNKK